MREDIYKNNEVVERICSHLWKCNGILIHSGLTRRNQLILFFVSALKDDILFFNQSLHSSDYLNELSHNIKQVPFYYRLYDIYSSYIEVISPNILKEFLNCINQVNRNDLKNNFAVIFEKLLQRIIDNEGKEAGESIQPKEISRLIIQLADLKMHDRVYNPFAGFGSFGIYLKKNQEYFAQEWNSETFAIAQMRLKAHNENLISNFEIKDSVRNWNDFQKYDFIVATPPFGMRIEKGVYSDYFGEPYGTVENFLIDKGIHSLSSDGKLITVFSLSFLFSSGRLTRLKKWLIDNDFIDTIITLPSGLFSNTSIPVCIIIFKISSLRPGYVKFINASSFFVKDSTRSKKLKDKAVIDLVNLDEENEYLKYVSTEEIYKNDFDLSVGRYFLRDIQGDKLRSFSSVIRGVKAPINEKIRQVHIRNLKEDVFDSILTSDELEYNLIKHGKFKLIDESCLLIATRWNTLKPTFFKYTGEPIVISQAVLALRLDESIIDPIFLINEFSADYIQEQVNSYRVGSVQPMLRKKDLENIKFQLLPIQEQKAKVSAIIELSERLRKIESEKENILSGIQKEETESSTSLSHILGKPLLSIGSSIEIIQNALSNLDPNWKSYLISQKRQFTLIDAFDSISKNVKYIQELADKNTSLVSVSNFGLNELHFLKLLSEFVKDEKKSLNNNISLKLDIHEDIKELMDNQVLIKGNSQKLRIVLVNLLDNAKNHAFINKENSNKINIEILPFTSNKDEASYFNYDIDDKKSYVEVRVSNTGSTFPKDFKLEDYVRKNFGAGNTQNSGLGGYEVNEIIKTHNEGKRALNIISNKEGSEYSSTVSFVIPIL